MYRTIVLFDERAALLTERQPWSVECSTKQTSTLAAYLQVFFKGLQGIVQNVER